MDDIVTRLETAINRRPGTADSNVNCLAIQIEVRWGDVIDAITEIVRLRGILRRCVPGADAVDIGGEMIGLYLKEDRSFADIKKEIRHGQQ